MCRRGRQPRSSSPVPRVDVESVSAGAVEEVAVAVVDGVGVGRSGADLGVRHRGSDDRGEVVELGAGVEKASAVA